MDSIPPEVWQEIFTHYYAQNPDCPPWILGHVNQLWRQISFSTPWLWNDIPSLNEYSNNNTELVKTMVQELIIRSGNAPLTLQFSFNLYHDDDDMDLSEIISLLLPHSHRWGDVSIQSTSFTNVQRRLGGPDIQFPGLTSISISIYESYEQEDGVTYNYRAREYNYRAREDAYTITFLKSSPRLQNIYIFDELAAVEWSMISHIPWSRITNYRETSVACILTIPHVLQASPLLHTLILDGNIKMFPSSPKLDHFGLRHLELRDQYNIPDMTSFLGSLSLPALEDIEIQIYNNHTDGYLYILPALTQLIVRSNCSLKRLHINTSDSPTDTSQLSDLLQLTPHLKQLGLSITHGSITSNIMELFIYKPKEKQPLIPYLSDFVIFYLHPRGKMKIACEISKVVFSRSKTLNSMIIQPRNSWEYYFLPGFYILQGLDFEQSLNTMCNHLLGLPYPNYDGDSYCDLARLIALDVLNVSEEQRLKCTPNDMCILLDSLYSSKTRYDVAAHLEDYQLISMLRNTLQYRTWMRVGGNSMAYISPNHKLRKSTHMWDLVLGGPGEMIPYLTNEMDEYPKEHDNGTSVAVFSPKCK